ncbi:MAG: 16S rRNA (cytosine(1402)-N(4))-methyltransferase RsmH [Dysgonamonadaceae bacterium]|jgi:16S rRNA (cytosine1402-N4)-methyltransferase|nr:16S rRNA (cytosine(1402)-N(4))-methyltransferase RsmH [Dysgonamonadaceae bacterium]
MTEYHTPVLLNESVGGLNIQPEGVYVDVTFGGGGHSREILRCLGKNGRLYAFDQDSEAYENRIDDNRFVFVRSNFRYLKNFLRYYGEAHVDGVLADLGVSSHHFDDSSRGFSFRFDGDLDMRMNRWGNKSASDVLNGYSEEQLSNLFFFYGELKSARKIAQAIVLRREKEPIKTVADFRSVMEPFAFRDKEKKILAQAFQALRIEVNDEMEALKQMLRQALEVLCEGGRLSVISYHSLEDRLVKNFFRSGNFEGETIKDFYGNPITPFEVVNRKVIVPSEQEQIENPRSRSAKLRIAKKLNVEDEN